MVLACFPHTAPRPPPPPPPPSSPNSPANPAPPDSLRPPPSLLWIDTLRSLTDAGRHGDALSAFAAALAAGANPDHFAVPAALKSCTALGDVAFGSQIHALAVKSPALAAAPAVPNSLITMYARCGELPAALKVFDTMPNRDAISYNSAIAALCMFEEWAAAVDVFRGMLQECGEPPTTYTLTSVLLACSNLRDGGGLRLGKEIHCYGFKQGLILSSTKRFASNALIAMYSKLGSIRDSWTLFRFFDWEKDVVTWNTMISLLVQSDRFDEAVAVLQEMVVSGVAPDGITLSSALPAYSFLGLLRTGREIHGYTVKNDALMNNSFVASALVDMYCTAGHVETARAVFDDVAECRLGLWNAMICGYTQNGRDKEALEMFVEMVGAAGLVPNETTMAGVLPACARSPAFPSKGSMHGYAVKRGMAGDKYVQNALVDMYSRVGEIAVALEIFGSMAARDVVSWNTAITGCIVSGLPSEAFRLMSEMQAAGGEKPNNVTLMTVLPACGALVAPAKGKAVHAYALRHGLDSDVAVGSALVDMYAKCGDLAASRAVFDRLPRRNAVAWNVLIMAYGMHGLGEGALELFGQMAASDEARPNGVTFIAALAACSHSGMVDRGLEVFNQMKDYAVEPSPDHYSCVVDLLGRAGKLEDAYDLLITMESSNLQSTSAWSSLLGACRVHRNVELGAAAADRLFELEPDEAGHYVLLSNIYSAAGMWAEANAVRRIMKQKGVIKEPGISWTEAGGAIHRFMAGESAHPESAAVHAYVGAMWERMQREGYVPDTSCVLHDVGEAEKRELLKGHSEKLAIGFGLMTTAPGAAIRVGKNLRVCNDCHEAAKFISRMEGRTIILRDVKRFHHFVGGSCSCGDYW